MSISWKPSRRNILQGTAAVAGATALGWYFARDTFLPGAAYPERNINVIIPTREGGGADRNFRAFTGIWKNYLKTKFEPGFFPSPQSNDVDMDGRGLVYLIDRNAGFDIQEMTA